MPRLSKLIEKAEDKAESHNASRIMTWILSRFSCAARKTWQILLPFGSKIGSWYERHKSKLRLFIPAGIVGWYFYGMFINSLRLGIASTFSTGGEKPTSIWVANPFKNFIAVLTPFGLMVSAVIVLLICLITKKGYIWFSGYKYMHDKRGFDILPDGTHGTSGFLTEKEMREFLELGPVQGVKGMALGKYKRHPDDPEKYALYVAHEMKPGNNNNLLCIGAPGSGKSRGFIIPFLLGCADRGESVFITDPKGELFEKMSRYFEEKGHYVKAVNFLDMEHSDGWNCLYGLDQERQLVQTVANTIIQNTSGPNESDDFWSRAELNLLMAMIHYVVNLKDDKGNLLPIEERGLGKIYHLLAEKTVNEINNLLAELLPDHPAKGPHGLFLKAKENLWGNIVIGLGNRLAIFQDQLVDKITRNHDVDLTLPGKRPCAYFVIISAQDSAYRFLSSSFFSLAIPQLSNYARLHGPGGRLPVLTNFCLDEYCNIGYMEGMADALNSIRGFNMSCQIVVQSLSQWQEKYPGKEWENQLGTFNQTLYMGCNDMTSAKYISEKCGNITISVTNNQMPLMPLFSPIYTSTRPYSQTRSNTQRALMQPDEILRLDYQKCIAMFQGHKPALLYKLAPEEFPAYETLKPCRVIDYVPEWKRREERAKGQEPETADATPPAGAEKAPEDNSTAAPETEAPPASPQEEPAPARKAEEPVSPGTAKPMEPAYDYTGVAPDAETKPATSGGKQPRKETYGQLGMFESDDSEVLGMDDDDGYEQ